jgi:hypothetical protein
VRILGHAGRILRSYLHDLLRPRHSNIVAMMELENHDFVVSPVWLFQYPESSGCFSLTSRKSLPMGVKMANYMNVD